MNGIAAMISLLLDTRLESEQRDDAQAVRDSARALLNLINDVLDVARIESGRLVVEQMPFHLEGEVREVAGTLRGLAVTKGLALTVEREAELPARLLGDGSRIRQIAINLVGNAIKFTSAGGVRVRLGGRRIAGTRWEVWLEVEDSGVGIEERKLESIFEKFVQADASTTRQFGGTGLGLSIS
ncbi:MAG: hypothetical protein FJW31_18770 [Acidobacteria bacterium]|nr:hypothetical protein [Acidobacteriota bacterium]